jgi:hypothetical protein
MSHSRKLIIPALAAISIIGLMSLSTSAAPADDAAVVVDAGGDGKNNPPPDDGKNNPPPDNGGNNPPPDNGGNNPPPDNGGNNPPPNNGGNNPPPDNGKNNPPPQNPAPRPNYGGGVHGGDGGFNQMARRFACYNGYQIIMVRNLRECGFGIQRRVVTGGGYRVKRPRARYAYNGGYAAGGGYAYGGGYATGGGYGYAYPQPIVRYYKPASRAAVMQAQKRARRAAQYSYGAGYGYDNGGYAGGGYVGGYGYGNGGYPAGYGAQMGYGKGYVGVRRHKAKRAHRRHAQAYGAMGGYNAGYGYDAGYGAGFGYGGTTIHYGPVMTKDGAY